MSKFHVKVYVVTRSDDTLLAIKLTFAEAHTIARKFAPARVTMVLADKTPDLNWPLVRDLGQLVTT